MLTKNDLVQIRGVVKEEVGVVDRKLSAKIEGVDKKFDPIHKELKKQGGMLETHGGMLNQIGGILKQHGKLLRSLKKDQKTMLNLLDGEQMQQRKRLKRVEEHLGISSIPA